MQYCNWMNLLKVEDFEQVGTARLDEETLRIGNGMGFQSNFE